MKTLTLDYKKWRCGFNASKTNIRHGRGATNLRNYQGYECCLGQFSLQLNKSLSVKDIIDNVEPRDISQKINLLNKPSSGRVNVFINTDFSNEAININDDQETTIPKKIMLLRQLLREHNYILRVINLPAKFKNK